jgi:predicted phage terminase large subunit-like protein
MQVMTTDAAFKDTELSSFVVTQVWGKRGPNSYLLFQSRKRLTFTATLNEIIAIRKNFPQVTSLLIEDKANGPAIIEVLSSKIPGVIAVEPLGSKEARAEAAAPLIEAGNVWLPHPDEEPWVEMFIKEWLQVPTGAFWDQVDASAQYILKYGRNMAIEVAAQTAVSNGAVTNNDVLGWATSDEPESVMEGFLQ